MRYQHDGGLLHPVLGQGDDHYPGCKFSADMRYQLDKTQAGEMWAAFEVTFSCGVDAIRNLVSEASAVCAVWVYCNATSYRSMERASKGQLSLRWRIRRDELNGLVELHAGIYTLEDVWLPMDQAHPMYGSSPRLIPARSPLAMITPQGVHIESDDGLDPAVQSILQLRQVSNRHLSEGVWSTDIDTKGPVVYIDARPDTYKTFHRIKDDPVAAQTLYLAALVDVIGAYTEAARDGDGSWLSNMSGDKSKWAGVITDRLNENGITAQPDGELKHRDSGRVVSRLEAAQMLLDRPLQAIGVIDGDDDGA